VLAVGALVATAALVQPPQLKPRQTHAVATPTFGDPLELGSRFASPSAAFDNGRASTAAVGLAALIAAQPDAAMAKGGEFGIFEGRIVSLAHPAMMACVYGASAFSAFTGWQWRSLREVGSEISALKAELKGPKAMIAEQEAKEETPPAALVSQVKGLQSQIDELTAKRKELADGSFRDKHYQAGSLVLGLGTSFAIEGPVNTFIRAQKLFPGPHLYAGAGIVVCWAMAASLVPLMTKGSDGARNAHMAFNVLALGLFTWQLPTGWAITQKVIQFTKFP